MFDDMKRMMEFKKKAEQLKKELDASYIDVEEVAGIKMVISGSQDVRAVEIDEKFLNPANKARLETDLARSINAAIKKSQALAAQKMRSVTGLNIPGL